MAHSVHTPAHGTGAGRRTEDGIVFVVLVALLCWLVAMMTLPMWLPALARSFAG